MTILLKDGRSGSVSRFASSADYWRSTVDKISNRLIDSGFSVDSEQVDDTTIEISYR